jgi:hypothetical protein
MDRIRAGLTGLAAVFLVTAAASLLFGPDDADTAAETQQEPGEPLAQLGVAPGSDKIDEAERDQKAATPEPEVPEASAQPSGGPPLDGQAPDTASPRPAGAGPRTDPDRPVAI